jgi:hypothetical protein
MGYTHYWNFKKNPKDVKDGSKKFAKAVELLKKCLAKVPAEIEVETYDWQNGTTNKVKVPFVLKGGNGEGEPKFTDELVCFNGDASMDYDHETCYLALDNDDYEFDFCKTARKPYDVAVCLTLLCFKKTFGDDFSYSSDGNQDDEGWKMAHNIFNKIK